VTDDGSFGLVNELTSLTVTSGSATTYTPDYHAAGTVLAFARSARWDELRGGLAVVDPGPGASPPPGGFNLDHSG
jgi:hypothetical protein